jgi:arylsulfatase A
LAIWEETSIPSFAELAGTEVTCDGKSFYPLLTNNSFKPREAAFVYYDPRWGKFVNVYRNQFVQTTDYKLYHDSILYDLKRDRLEQNPLNTDSLNKKVKKTYLFLKKELNKHPAWEQSEK